MIKEQVDVDFKQVFQEPFSKVVFLATYNPEKSESQMHAVSWIAPVGKKSIRIAVSTKSIIVENIEQHASVSFSFFHEKRIYEFRCQAKIITKQMEGVPFPLTLLELEAGQINNIMFYGADITMEPQFEKNYNAQAAEKLDGSVYRAMFQLT